MKVLLLDCDTLRADHLGCYGYRYSTSPNLDRFVAGGTRFARFFAPNIPTQPAHTSIFTGQHGVTHGVMTHGSPRTQLPPDAPWLPSILKKAGILTAAVDNLVDHKPWFGLGWTEYHNPRAFMQLLTADEVNDYLLPWLRRHATEDWFMFAHYWDAHSPYLPPEDFKERHYGGVGNDPDNRSLDAWRRQLSFPFFEKWHLSRYGDVTDLDYIRSLYDAEISYLDDRLGAVFATLDELRISEETVVLVTADHGEVMYDHPGFFDHAGLYDDTLHVPLIARGPGVAAGQVVSGMYQHVDLAPTILALFGLPVPPELEGRSLLPSLRGEPQDDYEAIYLSEATWQIKWGIRTKRWKLIKAIDPGLYEIADDELYDLKEDPREQNNLARVRPGVRDELELQLRRWWETRLGQRSDPLREQARVGVPARAWIERLLQERDLTWEAWVQRQRYI